MRVTDSLFYQNSKNSYQNSLKKLYDVNAQISSGSKIQNSYEDSSVYVDTMRLNNEISTLDQVKRSSSKAQTFANNTDETMNQFSDTLMQFKTKLIQAANGASSSTSLDAIANDLSAMKDHLISVANTSIDGEFLFSGSALDVKPISSDGSYNGNSQSLTSLVGSKVQLPYNVDGQSLFMGKDSDYDKIVSTNVIMYNKTTQKNIGDDVYLKSTDTVRDMVGDKDDDKTNDPKTVFYLSGRKPNGDSFNERFSLDSASKVSDLLDKIGTTYGNTSTNKLVAVSLNSYGQIEVKDLKKGNSLLDMNIFGAVDRDASSGDVGNAEQNDIDDLVTQKNVDIISFDKSSFLNTNTASKTGVSSSLDNAKEFKLNSPFIYEDGKKVEIDSTLQSFMGSSIDHIILNGTKTDNSAVTNDDFSIDNTTTVQDLMDKIESDFGNISTRFENGQLYITDKTTGDSSNFDLSLTSQNDPDDDATTNNNVNVNGFSTPDSMNYSRRGFTKNGNDITGNVSQIVKDSSDYATASTKLIDVAGVSSLNGKTLDLKLKDIDGIVHNDVTIDFKASSSGGSTFTLGSSFDTPPDTLPHTYNIYDANGDAVDADKMTYRQLNDVISMVVSNNIPKDNDPADLTISHKEYNSAVKDAKEAVDVSLDYRGRINIHDKTNSISNIDFAMYDDKADKFDGSKPSMSFMANNTITIQEPYVDIFNELDEMISSVRAGNFHIDSDSTNPRNPGIQNSLLRIDHISDHIEKMHTKIGSYSNALQNASERADFLSINVKTIRSQVADVDIGEAYMNFTKLSNSYQATLSTIAKINSMSLLNYL